MFNKIMTILCSVILSVSCDNVDPAKPTLPETTAKQTSNRDNYLAMKINGKEWKADNEIFGAFHPEGYNKAIMIAGSRGPKDKNEQAFNINLYDTNGAGIFTIKNGNTDYSVIQLANLSPQNYLYGSMMGFTVKINVYKATKNPTEIEATFEGVLTGNASDQLVVTEGKFYYHE